MPLPTMRKSKDGGKLLLHEDYFNLFIQKNEEGNPILDGVQTYAHNSPELAALLQNDEWAPAETETASADFIQVAAARNLMQATKTGIQSMSLTPSEALKVKDVYPDWAEGIPVKQGERYNSDGWLWEALQSHTTQANWKPSLETASLWKRVDEEHSGTLEDPIPFAPPMELFKDKYYTQSGLKYLCSRDSGQALSYNLADLVGLYVELVE